MKIKKLSIKQKTTINEYFSHNNKTRYGQNIIMNKLNKNNNSTKIHVMPPQISDEDINALFNGIVNVVKKKIELEKNAEIINLNINHEKLIKELNEKKSEIIRLKNEIIYLKSKIKENEVF